MMEYENDSDIEVDDKQHAKLVEDVLALNRRPQLKKPTRTEPSLQVSEFHLVKSITGKQGIVHVNDLTKVLKKRAKHVEISKKLRSTERKATILPKPLEKPQAQRLERSIAYENTKKTLNRWDAIVAKNRSAHHLPFPIPPKLKLYTSGETIKEFNARKNAEENEFPLTMNEILERRQEVAKMRAIQSYKEAKARRQSKIKSKKYHRIQRKEKMKSQMKEFEQLQQTNPEEALKKLEEIERARAEERASLRHHGTGKWAKSKQIRAKYDKESRQVLAEQLSISRDLKQKLKKNEESESDNEPPTNDNPPPIVTNNPWTNPSQSTNEVAQFMDNYRKFWEKVNEPLPSKAETLPNIQNKENLKVQVSEVSSSSNIPIKKPKEKILLVKKIKKDIKTISVSESTSNDKKKQHTKNLGNKEISKKVKKTVANKNKDLKYLGTTEWNVGNLSSEEDTTIESLNLDDVFESYQKKLKQKIDTKYKDLKTNALNTKSAPKTQIKKQIIKEKQKALPRNDNSILIDENCSETNDNISPELQVLKNILSSSEKIVDGSTSGLVKTTSVNLNTDVPDLFTLEENEENIDQKGTITEAFEDDDIVEEFYKNKQTEIDSEKPEDIDLNLPGWGSWGGVGIKASKRKNKRLIINFPKEFKRKDDNKDDVFINEKTNKAIKKHMVSEVPFPFKSVKDFEASIRAPIGDTFVPDLAFEKMIKPSVTTKMGAIIEPMSVDVLID